MPSSFHRFLQFSVPICKTPNLFFQVSLHKTQILTEGFKIWDILDFLGYLNILRIKSYLHFDKFCKNLEKNIEFQKLMGEYKTPCQKFRSHGYLEKRTGPTL